MIRYAPAKKEHPVKKPKPSKIDKRGPGDKKDKRGGKKC